MIELYYVMYYIMANKAHLRPAPLERRPRRRRLLSAADLFMLHAYMCRTCVCSSVNDDHDDDGGCLARGGTNGVSANGATANCMLFD